MDPGADHGAAQGAKPNPKPGGIVILAPRNTRFSPASATSIDLYIHEIAVLSRYRDAITVFAESLEQPFTDVSAASWTRAEPFRARLARLAETEPRLIVVHQHLPTADRLTRALPDVPVALVRHNFVKPPLLFSAWAKRRQMGRLAGIAFVSECCRAAFEAAWPEVATERFVTPNGVDASLWRPAAEKARRVLFVGRLAPEKGVLEAARALTRLLPERPDWQALFILDTRGAEPGYAARVRAALAEAGAATVTDVPHARVQAEMARAAIVLAPTQNAEPFGRVAIEAMASGAALVASRAGGFVEIADGAALLLPRPDAPAIAAATARLMDHPAEAAALGAAGRDRVAARYGLEAAAAAFDAMAARLMGEALPHETTPLPTLEARLTPPGKERASASDTAAIEGDRHRLRLLEGGRRR
ncbi:MAG: glycosyltransferase family 4 protein [Pseudomonadota bacterium]